MTANTLFLRLEGPLQSWGERSRWSVRDTATAPTKSAIIGLIACALGYKSDEQIRPLSEKTQLGVRIDALGTQITDYHTIGGGYDYPTLLTAQGKRKGTSKAPHTEISPRAYLCDASFLAALQVRDKVDSPLIHQMSEALQNPVWPIYLGRKACVPSRPVYAGNGEFDTLYKALAEHQQFTTYFQPKNRRREHEQTITLATIVETDDPQGQRQRDNLYSRQYRIYHPRYTRRDKVTLVLKKEENGDVSLQTAA